MISEDSKVPARVEYKMIPVNDNPKRVIIYFFQKALLVARNPPNEVPARSSLGAKGTCLGAVGPDGISGMCGSLPMK